MGNPSPAPSPFLSPKHRLVVCCLLAGVLGAVAALLFDGAVELAQRWLLGALGGFVPPPVGRLGAAVALPDWGERWRLPLVTALGGLLSGVLVYTLAPEAEGHGTDAAIAAYHSGAGGLRRRVPFVKGVASALTIGSGGVAGREGPAAQISVGLGSIVARVFRLRGRERRTLLLASMAAGLAAVFRAPLGMAIFAVEILYSGMVFESEALVFTVISAVTAYAIHGFFVGWSPIFAIPRGLGFDHPLTLLGFGALGVAAGVLGAVLPAVFYRVRDRFHRLPGPPHVKPALGGLLVGLLGVAVPQVLGSGYGWVELAAAGRLSVAMLLLLVLLRVPAMALTIGSGGAGGVFGPTVTLGALLGGALGLGLDRLFPHLGFVPAAFVVVGMAALFAGAARTPISTLIMVVEMTGGYGLIVPAMLANVVAYLVQRWLTAGRRYPTLYESQVESREDSPLHRGLFVRRAFDLIEGGGLEEHQDLTLPRLVSLLRFGRPIPISGAGELLVSLAVAPGSGLAGRTVAEEIGAIEGATAVAVLRGDRMLVPRGPTRLEAGDEVVAAATPAAHERLRERAAAPAG